MKRRNFSTVRKMTKGVRMVHQDLLNQHPLALQGHFMQLLRGFDEEMQIEMADDLDDFTNHHIAHTTGVIAADVILDIGYKMIAYEHNILKKGEYSRMRNLDKKRSALPLSQSVATERTKEHKIF